MWNWTDLRQAAAQRRQRAWRGACSWALSAVTTVGVSAALARPLQAQPLGPELRAAAAVTEPVAGEHYTVQEFDWVDARRGRAVPVRLYLPLAANRAQVAHPLVVFSHGIGGSRRGYSYLGRHWASQGYASLHLQHVGSDRSLWLGNPLALAGRLQAAAQDSEATARVGDLSFALDQLLAGPLAPRIDGRRIVAAGHSYGANTTLLAVGAEVQRGGHILPLRDVRIQAAIVISAPPFYGEASPETVLRHIRVPSLHITATDDIIRVPGYYSPAVDRVAVFDGDAGALRDWAQRFGSLLARTSIKQ